MKMYQACCKALNRFNCDALRSAKSKYRFMKSVAGLLTMSYSSPRKTNPLSCNHGNHCAGLISRHRMQFEHILITVFRKRSRNAHHAPVESQHRISCDVSSIDVHIKSDFRVGRRLVLYTCAFCRIQLSNASGQVLCEMYHFERNTGHVCTIEFDTTIIECILTLQI